MRVAVAVAVPALADAAFLLVGASSSGQAVTNHAAKHRIGTFDAPIYLTHAPGAPNFLYVRRADGPDRGDEEQPSADGGRSSTSTAG